MCLTLIVGERPIGGSAVGAGCFCRSSIKVRAPCAVSVPARLQEGAGDERGPAPESSRRRTHERADRALGHAGLRPARRRPWRIRRWRFKGLTGDDRTRCAGCWRRREAVVAEPRLAFVGLTPPAGTERAPRRPLTPDGALIPAGVDLRQDGAPEGIEFRERARLARRNSASARLTASAAPKRAMNSGIAEPRARFSRRSSSREGIRSRSISDMEVPHRLSDERSS